MSSAYYTSQRNVYDATAHWGSDGLNPSAIGTRVLDMLDRTSHLVPAGQQWFVIDRKRMKYAPVTQSLPNLVETNEIPGDFGESNPGWGYSVGLFTLSSKHGPPSANSLSLSLTAGSTALNHIDFEIGESRYPPDYTSLRYQTYREMIGAIAETWPCRWIFARNSRSPRVHPPADVAVNGPLKPPFGGAWIAYLSAPLASGLASPAELVTEPTTGGGLFLSATRTLLDVSNADEMRRSRLLEKIAQERIGYGTAGGLPRMTPVRVGPA
jgi:hypothetical protein